MARPRVLVAVALLALGASLPLSAQQPAANPPRPKTPATPGATAGKTLRPQGAPAAQPGAPANPTAPVTPSPTPAVTPQAQAAPAAPAAPANAFTAGLAIAPFSGTGDAARYEYLRTLAHNIDSATVELIGVYRNTSGQPMAGATTPAALSARERERWSRCRGLYWDFSTFGPGLESARQGLSSPALARAAAALDTALAEVAALEECDNVSSMISAPERWDPWAQQYATAARHFYADWYGQVYGAHDKVRALVVALNGVLPAGRTLAVPPGLPRNPPYAGAGVR